MINGEKFKDEILEICKSDGRIALSDGKIRRCGLVPCRKCEFNGEDNCTSRSIIWMFEEYKKTIQLSEFEYKFLENINNCWEWIARDEDGYMYLYESKPHKEKSEGTWKAEDPQEDIFNLTGVVFDDLFSRSFFDFIEWNDEEPYKVKSILDNCEVLEEVANIHDVMMEKSGKNTF